MPAKSVRGAASASVDNVSSSLRTSLTLDALKSSSRSSSRNNNNNCEIALTGASLVSSEASKTLKFEDHYILKDQFAKGSFGTVYATEHVQTGQEFAVKVIERARLSDKDKNLVIREVGILKDCRDISNIVQLIDFFDSPDKYYVVQVRAKGGDVFARLSSQKSYNEGQARDLAYHLLQAMKALHERKVAHNNINTV